MKPQHLTCPLSLHYSSTLRGSAWGGGSQQPARTPLHRFVFLALRRPCPEHGDAPLRRHNLIRDPNYSSTRRTSIWAGGSQQSAPSGSQTSKDPRPLRDRQYQSKMRQDILSYLQGDDFDISMGTLTNIQGKDYRAIFTYLLLTLDPCHPLNENARFEEQFVPALKSLKYPYAHQIDNKWLAAPASMHSWPSLLGVLHWLVEVCKVRLIALPLSPGI